MAKLLQKCGSPLEPSAVRSLLAGVLAAPRGEDPDAWHVLVCPDPGTALRGQLRALERETRKRLVPGPDAAADRRPRLEALRTELARRGLDGFVVPRFDEHQGEYVPVRGQRLAWLTGFTGSAGAAVVLAEAAAIFVDGRYTLQVTAEVDQDLFTPRHLIEQPPTQWIAEHLPKGGKLGYDPWLHTHEQVGRLAKAAAKAGGELVACPSNPLDAVWIDQPPPPIAPVVAHDVEFAGRPSADKRSAIAAAIAEAGAAAAVLSEPASIAWVLNVRGADVPHTPLPLSFAIIHTDSSAEWFVEPRKLVPGLRDVLGNEVAVAAPDQLGAALDALGAAGRAVLADPAGAPSWVLDRLEAAGAKIVQAADPCALPKAQKSEAELAGMRAAHVRDGAALSRFLCWLDGAAPGVTEIEAAERLHALRRAGERFCDLSFDTISGSGPNGAIVHYRVSAETNRRLGAGELYLVDSGAQYLDGTTDVTRTVAIGTPSAEMRERFTRVLKGHIALATVRFPKGTTGSQLDALARLPLWQAGLDYDHGTGHGVGSYLGVHEGPQRISKLPSTVALAPGMIVSNEPGYYKTGAYGIRIENLVAVVAQEPRPGEEREMLGFETLTLAPIDRRLVDPALMTHGEIAWLDAYYARVREILTPLLADDEAAWLEAATAPIA